MSARDSILGRLRATNIANEPALPDVGAWYDGHQRAEDGAQRIARLRAALDAVKAEVHDTTATEWPALLLGILASKGLRNLLIGCGTPHGEQLQVHMAAPSINTPAAALQLLHYSEGVESWRDSLFDTIDASLTSARSAIAETGSLVLWPTASEPRLMSLIPPVHCVLLDANSIHADLHGAMRAEGWKDRMPTNALLICGPSKTADIQQTLAYGAHGPRELVVLLCQPTGDRA